MTQKEFGMTKYNSKKTTIDGITFDSKIEAERYQQLKLMEQADPPLIMSLKLQPELQILEGWIDPEGGEKHRSRFYVGDFKYFDNEKNKWVIEDVKGMETPEFRLKWEYAQSQYPEYEFRKVTRDMV